MSLSKFEKRICRVAVIVDVVMLGAVFVVTNLWLCNRSSSR